MFSAESAPNCEPGLEALRAAGPGFVVAIDPRAEGPIYLQAVSRPGAATENIANLQSASRLLPFPGPALRLDPGSQSGAPSVLKCANSPSQGSVGLVEPEFLVLAAEGDEVAVLTEGFINWGQFVELLG